MADLKAASTQEYVERTGLEETVKEALNELLKTKPEDSFGVLSRILQKKAKTPRIEKLVGREVLDSRGNPTVEVDVYANHLGRVILAGRSSAPSGASTGSNEARELRETKSVRYGGRGVLNAVKNVSTVLSDALKSFPLDRLRDMDQEICLADGTALKERIGGNATTATSFALAEAAANVNEEQLFQYLARQFHDETSPLKYSMPVPFFNILNGGKHAGGKLKIQEFMITPRGTLSYPDQLRVVTEVYHKLGQVLVKEYGVSAKNLGDEGGYAPLIDTPEEALGIIERSIKEAGYEVGKDIFIALDAAASEFYNTETAKYEVETGVYKTGDEMIEYWQQMISKHPSIISLEDPLHEKDYEHWIKLTEQLGEKVLLVGDDLYTTNPKTIALGIENRWANSLLLKVNQIGTITEAMEAAKLVSDAGQKVIVSHRSGETCNSVISDLAVAIGAQFIKTGSVARGERIQKYTRLLQIYEYLTERDMLL